jgi:hypothetical protein
MPDQDTANGAAVKFDTHRQGRCEMCWRKGGLTEADGSVSCWHCGSIYPAGMEATSAKVMDGWTTAERLDRDRAARRAGQWAAGFTPPRKKIAP